MEVASECALVKVSIAYLAAEARRLSVEAFEERYGATALLAKPTQEQLKRAALQLSLAATVSVASTDHLDELLIMLRGFRGLTAFFFKPSRAPQTFTVGRQTSCDAKVDDPSVSKLHASLTWTGEGWRIRDEASLNGTFVNSGALSKADTELVNGDAVALGEAQLVFIRTRTLRSQLLALKAT